MNRKIWYKALHKRKIWRHMSLSSKCIYYMEPFIVSIFNVWFQSLPFPTLFKFALSFVFVILIIMPVLFPFVLMSIYYGIMQYLVESTFDVEFTKSWDLIHHIHYIWNYEISNEKHILFVNLYLERLRCMGALITSIVDYFRLLIVLATP